MFEIGTSLREARLRQGVDIAEAEQGTKVRSKYLRALEDERFDLLPGHTYVKGFLRSYAEYLGLDGQLYVDEYNSRFITGEDEQPLQARRRSPSRLDRRLDSRVIILTLAAIAGVTALVIAAGNSTPPQPRIPNLTTPAAANTVQPNPRTRPAVAAPVAKPRPMKARLVVTATRGDSWLEVRVGSAAGKQVYAQTLPAGRRAIFVHRRLWVSLGAPSSVDVTVNGKRQTLPASGSPQLVVTPAGITAA